MRTFDKGILTEKGNELLVEAAAGKQIEFTKLATGCGNYDVLNDELIGITALREQRQEFCFTEIEKISESSVLLKAVISNRTIENGYYITEVGIYGKVQGTENEVLYSLNIVNMDNADFLPPYNGIEPTEITLSCYITIKQDTKPKVTLGDAMDILLNEIDEEARRAIEAETNNLKAIEAEEKRAKEQEAQKAPINSPIFIGTPQAPTPEISANNEQLATTAFVKMIVNALVNGAPSTLDTLGEVAEAFAENETILAALNAAIGEKLGKTETAAAASKWETCRNINGLIIDGTSNRASYGTCSTAAATAAKTVSCTGFGLVLGAEITVKFTVTNTAANPTLNVGGTGAKPIFYRGAAITAGYLAANTTYIFRYNGTQWELVGDVNTNTTYNDMKGATADAAGTRGLVPAPAAGTVNRYLCADGTWKVPPTSTSLAGTVQGIPLDQTAGKALKDQLDKLSGNLKGFVPVVDSTGKITGYKTQAGADTVFPFNSLNVFTLSNTGTSTSKTISAKHGYIVVSYHTTYGSGYISVSSNVTLKTLWSNSTSYPNHSATGATYYEFNVTNNDPITITLTSQYNTSGYALIAYE